ncbi:MAG: hypothetical protein AAF741_06245 [Bacteroidota bacterium]
MSNDTVILRAQEYVKQGQLVLAIDEVLQDCNMMLTKCENSVKKELTVFKKNLLSVSGRFNSLSLKNSVGVLNQNLVILEENQIRGNVLDLINTYGTLKETLLREILEDKVKVVKERETTEVEITITEDFDSYDINQKEKLLKAISHLLDLEDFEIKIKKMYRGSVKIVLEIPVMSVSKLLSREVRTKLSEFNVESIRLVGVNVHSVFDLDPAIRGRLLEIAMEEMPEAIRAVRAKAIEEVFKKDIEQLDDGSRGVLEKILSYIEERLISIPIDFTKSRPS